MLSYWGLTWATHTAVVTLCLNEGNLRSIVYVSVRTSPAVLIAIIYTLRRWIADARLKGQYPDDNSEQPPCTKDFPGFPSEKALGSIQSWRTSVRWRIHGFGPIRRGRSTAVYHEQICDHRRHPQFLLVLCTCPTGFISPVMLLFPVQLLYVAGFTESAEWCF